MFSLSLSLSFFLYSLSLYLYSFSCCVSLSPSPSTHLSLVLSPLCVSLSPLSVSLRVSPQHAMMFSVLTHHVRYHHCQKHLDKLIGQVFKERCLLQLAMTHPSHQLNFGMNPDHARNSLSNCGIRQPKYGDREVHHMYMRKKGINTLINIKSCLRQDDPSPSRINYNERLEFLGDAVVDVHLFNRFPCLEEGGLATYRTAIVQNQHLVMLAKKLELDRFMFYVHRPDLYRESDLRPAMATCFEALIVECVHPSVSVIHRCVCVCVCVTMGHNQRMEFLGDSIMQLMATEYLFIHFPDHHEGHLTFLRSSLVNNRTQVNVEEELAKRLVAPRTKTLADLLEFHTFVNVYFFPQLKENLQQFCLTLGTEGKEPDIPLYKTLQTVGPERIGCGKGPRYVDPQHPPNRQS
uniref:RNase III domain-containing protein n=1 Tax=Salmo trutta TaxID=8032 RepID=A0A673XWP6_SALTR